MRTLLIAAGIVAMWAAFLAVVVRSTYAHCQHACDHAPEDDGTAGGDV